MILLQHCWSVSTKANKQRKKFPLAFLMKIGGNSTTALSLKTALRTERQTNPQERIGFPLNSLGSKGKVYLNNKPRLWWQDCPNEMSFQIAFTLSRLCFKLNCSPSHPICTVWEFQFEGTLCFLSESFAAIHCNCLTFQWVPCHCWWLGWET